MSVVKSFYGFKPLVRVRSLTTTAKVLNAKLKEPTAPIPGRFPKWSSNPSSIFADLKDGNQIFIHGCTSSPVLLVNLLADHIRAVKPKHIEVVQHFPLGDLPFIENDFKGLARMSTSLSNQTMSRAISEGNADYIPISVGELPLLYRKQHFNIDYALIMVTPPDKHGFCSLGSAVGSARSAIQNSKRIIGQVNPLAPVTYGDTTIHVSQIDYLFHGEQQLFEMPLSNIHPTEQKIASIIAEHLIENGSTLQLGFGNIPNAVSRELRDHKDLGVHTEMINDSIIDLVRLGVITNRYKPVRSGRIVASYALGTKRVYDFINENPLVGLYDVAWTNAPEVISRNPKVVAVNTCFEMDLTGQCAGDGVGTKICSGVGGTIDFLRGASISSDGLGRPIIAMCSTTPSGASLIVPTLQKGSGVGATRAHIHYIVTEYGIANLFGKTLRQRAHAIINIAHPDFRESLEMAAFERLKTMPAP